MNFRKIFFQDRLVGHISITGTILIIILGLSAVSFLYFSSTQEKESESQIQNIHNLKLLTSHSSPQIGEEWVVSFETTGTADLTITPEDQDTINDLDFVSLTCDDKEKAEAPQVLEGNGILFPNWQCTGKGEIIHLVNIARKHTLKFKFGEKLALAYNNPDSVTDTFDDESKIASKENITVSGGQAYLAICGDNGAACSVNGDCCSDNCQNSVCCATGETCCSSDDHCSADSCLSICERRNNYCDTTTDHYCKYTDAYCGLSYHCSGGSCVSGSCDTSPTCDKVCSAGSCVHQGNGQDIYNNCNGTTCSNRRNSASGTTCDDICDNYTRLPGTCNGSGSCNTAVACYCLRTGLNNFSNNYYWYEDKYGECGNVSGSCSQILYDASLICDGYAAEWTWCDCE